MASVVYFLQASNGDIKIGVASNYVARIEQLEKKHGKLTLLGVVPGDNKDERRLHQQFMEYHINGEWYRPSSELLAYIAENAQSIKHQRPAVVRLTPALVTALNILRKRYKTRSNAEALERFMAEHEPQLLEAGAKIVRLTEGGS